MFIITKSYGLSKNILRIVFKYIIIHYTKKNRLVLNENVPNEL